MENDDDSGRALSPTELSKRGRYIVLAAAFLGWMCAGLEMAMYIAARSAFKDFFGQSFSGEKLEEVVGQWFSFYICAFLLGAATGGLIFGWMGDRLGRSKTMGISILCFSILTGISYFVSSPEQFLALRFLACLGIGGMWPNAVALVSEAWSDASRPLLAGLIGTSANFGLALMGVIAGIHFITPEDWRWTMLIGATPAVLGVLVLFVVPESPRWLASRATQHKSKKGIPIATVFRPPFRKLTLIGIALGTIPLLGGWGSLNWLIPWAEQVGERIEDPGLKADTQLMRSSGAIIGSLLGGWLASIFGRRATYFVVSLGSLLISGYIFWYLSPTSDNFFTWVFIMGFVGTIYFGWLPLYLPELFPTDIRATGTGVTFNLGRVLSAVGVFAAGMLVVYFGGNYAHVGRVTHLIYFVGMVVILFAPDTSGRRMDD